MDAFFSAAECILDVFDENENVAIAFRDVSKDRFLHPFSQESLFEKLETLLTVPKQYQLQKAMEADRSKK